MVGEEHLPVCCAHDAITYRISVPRGKYCDVLTALRDSEGQRFHLNIGQSRNAGRPLSRPARSSALVEP